MTFRARESHPSISEESALLIHPTSRSLEIGGQGALIHRDQKDKYIKRIIADIQITGQVVRGEHRLFFLDEGSGLEI